MLTFLDPDGEPHSFDRLHILDFVQVVILSVSIFLCFSPRSGRREMPFALATSRGRENCLDGLLVVTFVLPAFLTKSKSVR